MMGGIVYPATVNGVIASGGIYSYGSVPSWAVWAFVAALFLAALLGAALGARECVREAKRLEKAERIVADPFDRDGPAL